MTLVMMTLWTLREVSVRLFPWINLTIYTSARMKHSALQEAYL
jgi:hypothetical protein